MSLAIPGLSAVEWLDGGVPKAPTFRVGVILLGLSGGLSSFPRPALPVPSIVEGSEIEGFIARVSSDVSEMSKPSD